MPTAKYLIRLDDACATLDQGKWARMEHILDAYAIKPVVAVVPDNRDPGLIIEEPDPEFWSRVRRWQAKGWSIAMHGLSHTLRQTDARQILPFHKRSEFSGLSYAEQADKIRTSKEIFDAENVRVDAWIAPAHGFDLTTLKVLKDFTDIKTISDGIAVWPYYENGFFWVPQQLWNFRRVPFGIWTICLHPNAMMEQALDAFERNVSAYVPNIINFFDLRGTSHPRRLLDRALHTAYWLYRGQYVAAFGW
jgi:hypothetical protein